MSTKSNTMENGKKITKHDLLTLFFRCFLLPACYSMDRMQAPGFAYSMIPVLKKLYGDNKEKVLPGPFPPLRGLQQYLRLLALCAGHRGRHGGGSGCQ